MPVRMTITADPDLKTLEMSFRKGIDKKFIRRRIALLAGDVRSRIQNEAPRKSGRLRKSILVRRLGELGQQIYVDQKSRGGQYEFFYRAGTRAHVILPRKRKALWWPGASHPVKKVSHPGFRGDDYWSRGIDMSSPDIAKAERDISQGIEGELFHG